MNLNYILSKICKDLSQTITNPKNVDTCSHSNRILQDLKSFVKNKMVQKEEENKFHTESTQTTQSITRTWEFGV